MIVAVLIVLGLCLGSFVNALVWRFHTQQVANSKQRIAKPTAIGQQLSASDLSIMKGRSMCPKCGHQLAARDLLPVVSWLSLRGRCRYCSQAISVQYPLVELAVAGLFVASYLWWPVTFNTQQTMLFVIWLVLLTGFMALLVYDLRWFLLPNRLLYPLAVPGALWAAIAVANADRPALAIAQLAAALAISGGLFYLLYQVSGGRWIGGGDIRLGWLLGLIVLTPSKALLLIFLASFFGSLVSLPLLAGGRLRRDSTIPFGPFLIVAAVVVQLFGAAMLAWYSRTFLMGSF